VIQNIVIAWLTYSSVLWTVSGRDRREFAVLVSFHSLIKPANRLTMNQSTDQVLNLIKLTGY